MELVGYMLVLNSFDFIGSLAVDLDTELGRSSQLLPDGSSGAPAKVDKVQGSAGSGLYPSKVQ